MQPFCPNGAQSVGCGYLAMETCSFPLFGPEKEPPGGPEQNSSCARNPAPQQQHAGKRTQPRREGAHRQSTCGACRRPPARHRRLPQAKARTAGAGPRKTPKWPGLGSVGLGRAGWLAPLSTLTLLGLIQAAARNFGHEKEEQFFDL